MLQFTRLRDLTLTAGATPQRPAWISAASGLVCAGPHLYVVADDELHLGVFSAEQDTRGTLLRLFPGELPERPKRRKKFKPDLELLLQLPAFGHYRHGALLALGSGSTQRRCGGALLSLDATGRINSAPTFVDAEPLFAALEQQVDELNLEGAWLSGQHLHLLQRGNKGGTNAVIRLEWSAIRAALLYDHVLPDVEVHIHEMPLGAISGVPLCFSDAVALADGRWLFSAVAEDTDNAIADGAFVGAAIGMADHHQVLWLKHVSPAQKIEGIALQRHDNGMRVLMVNDADDPSQPAGLFEAYLPL